MKIIIANGPPFSGKDTFVKHILGLYNNMKWCRFKDILYSESYKRLFNGKHITEEEWIAICNSVQLKDKPLPEDLSNIKDWVFYNVLNMPYPNLDTRLSPRGQLIFQSENIIKVEHGDGGVAKITCDNIKKNPNYMDNLYIFSDGGFNVEIETLIKELNITREDIIIVRLLADGCTFKGDSREFLDSPDFIINNTKDFKFFDNITLSGIFEKIANFL